MGYIYRKSERHSTYDENVKIAKILDAYGVDYIEDSTYLGEGLYKEVHRTNIEGVVMVITTHPQQLEEEMFILEMLDAFGYPTMEYYCSETIGHTILILGKALSAPTEDWSEKRMEGLKKQVEDILFQMVEDQIYCCDLQFMVDSNDSPVLSDPLSLKHDNGRYRDAICKDAKAVYGCRYIEINRDDPDWY